ncbi:ABC transporter ATP-binding protein [Sutterella sp.]|uniref:ABC transporter ATP-binding protein n=1 Tax=Sutterella sp. TaxID=1981025 RepID=UPI0026DEB99A|nr:ABC transporter ATP-binding protein [Sutterella sp.]MDO5532295.1 ABC transporter ATP-binding protein [Sutterella sp.]
MTAQSSVTPPDQDPLGLEVKNLVVRYDSEDVLRDVSFTLPPGASLAVVGESGCGKTTLLTTLAGLLKSGAGEVTWRTSSGRTVARPHSSFVWQSLGLLPWKRVRENLALPLRLRSTPVNRAEGERRTDAMITELGLAGLENRWPAQLSGGQRQRLALGRSLIADPEVLFMDEPFSALDALRREHLQEFLAGLRTRRHVTMIFVSHDIPEAVFLASHILMLAAKPARQIEFYENPAWRPGLASAERDSVPYNEACRHIRARLKAASAEFADA